MLVDYVRLVVLQMNIAGVQLVSLVSKVDLGTVDHYVEKCVLVHYLGLGVRRINVLTLG